MLDLTAKIKDAVYTGTMEFDDKKTGEVVCLHGVAWFGGFKRFRDSEISPFRGMIPGTKFDMEVDCVMSGSKLSMTGGQRLTNIKAPPVKPAAA